MSKTWADSRRSRNADVSSWISIAGPIGQTGVWGERKDEWMNEWRRRNVIQNQCEKYVTIKAALALRFTTGLIKARCQNFFLIEYSAIKMSSTRNQMNNYDPQALRTYWEHLDCIYQHFICTVNQNLSGYLYLDLSFSSIWKVFASNLHH